MTFDPTSVEVTCVTVPKDHFVQVPWKYIKVCGYSEPFCLNLNQRSLTPRWPLTPHLLRSHVWLCPRIIVSKSHGNTSMYVDTVINFAKITTYIHTHTYYVHTTYILHTTYRISDHIVSFWTTFRRDKKIHSHVYVYFRTVYMFNVISIVQINNPYCKGPFIISTGGGGGEAVHVEYGGGSWLFWWAEKERGL